MKKTIILAFTLSTIASLCIGQSKGYIQISSTDKVHFIVTDPHGQKTGRDPRGAADPEEGNPYSEISEAGYAFMSLGSLDTTRLAPMIHEFNYGPISPYADGVYIVQMIGITGGVFQFSISVGRPDQPRDFRLRSRGVIQKDGVQQYKFNYSGRREIPIRFAKVVSAISLLQDIAAMRKLDWITTQSTADKYAGLVTTYGNQIRQNNIKAAEFALMDVIVNLRADSGTVITTDAYKSLRADAEQVLTELPTVMAMLDTLISYKHKSSGLGWLADKNFVKELDNHLENAQKHLAKTDSTNAYKEIEKFQEKVNKEYEKTRDAQKKGKPRDKRFVTEDGWKLLYFNAQYIIDRLPSEKRGKKG
jgi:hypothetical protein